MPIHAHDPAAGSPRPYERLSRGVPLVLLLVAGCATVDPRADYDRTGRLIQAATGESADGARPDHPSPELRDVLENGLTADDAVRLALGNNPSFQAAWLNVGVARADLVQASLLSNPSLGFSLRLPSGGGLANLEASLAQNIADLWQIPARTRAAEHGLDQAILNLARQASTLAADVRQAYFQTVAAGETLAISRGNLEIARELLESARARLQAGAGTQVDVNLAGSAAVEAELQVESDRLASAQAARRLAVLLGLTGQAESLRLTQTLNDDDAALPPPERLVALARENRLDLQAAQANTAQAEATLAQAKLGVFSRLQLGVAMEREERRSGGGRDLLADTARSSIAAGQLTAPELEPKTDPGSGVIIGPSVSMDLPVFDQNQAAIARAGMLLQQAEHMQDALERQLVQDVRGAADRMETARRMVRLAGEQFVPLAERNLDMAGESYRAGKSSVLSSLESQRFLLEARRRKVTAQAERALAAAALEREVGLPLGRMLNGVEAAGSQPAGRQIHVGGQP